jgi:hypothetical protein
MKLFRKEIEPRCAYCQRGSAIGDGKVACVRKGVVDDTYHCRGFRYDPLKRIPKIARPVPSGEFIEL